MPEPHRQAIEDATGRTRRSLESGDGAGSAGDVERAALLVREALEEALARVTVAIREYPQPIPGCDAQYAHLLDERRRLAFEIRRARELAASRDREALAGYAEGSSDLGGCLARVRSLLGR